MIKIGYWDIRDPNDPIKQVEIRNTILVQGLFLTEIVETKVRFHNLNVTTRKSFPAGWEGVYPQCYELCGC